MSTSTPSPKEPGPGNLIFNVLSAKTIGLMVLQIAIIVGALVLGAVSLGRFLDELWDTRPWITVILAFASSIAACFITYRIGMRAVARTDRELPLKKPAATEEAQGEAQAIQETKTE